MKRQAELTFVPSIAWLSSVTITESRMKLLTVLLLFAGIILSSNAQTSSPDVFERVSQSLSRVFQREGKKQLGNRLYYIVNNLQLRVGCHEKPGNVVQKNVYLLSGKRQTSL